ELLGLTGVILTKMEGDARGGAALSIKSIVDTPIKFVGVGEKLSDLEVFHPDRVASRILGMGDILTLIEKSQEGVDEKEAMELERKFQKAEFDLEDFRKQMRRIRKLGSMESLLKMIPGMGKVRDKLKDVQVPEKELGRIEALINSMTHQERHSPRIINASRKERIARGSGATVQDVNQLLKNFTQMQKMLKKVSAKGMNAGGAMPKMPGMPGIPGGESDSPMTGKAPGAGPSAQKRLKAKRKKAQRKKQKKRR
ncbi:MAG: signal recognition particle protein, partial [Desulfohalobiaceae bacterium]